MATMRPPPACRTPPPRHRPARGCAAVPRLVRRAFPRRPPEPACAGGMRWTSCRSTRSPTRPRFAAPDTGSTSSAAASATPCSTASRPTFITDDAPTRGARLLEYWAEAVWRGSRSTVGARRHGTTVEITTFRADAYDRVSRNPVVAFGETIEDDLVRRDFTVNAMPSSTGGQVGGHRRCRRPARWPRRAAAGTLDTPATPEESFADDPLRMLRAARFVSQLDLTPAPGSSRP